MHEKMWQNKIEAGPGIRRNHKPHLEQLWKDLLKIVGCTWPTFYSQIYNVAYIIVETLQYIIWELSDHIHMISESIYKEFFVEYVSKLAVKIKKK